MASRKPAKSRHKLSFAVDRGEIDISSDWVQAVMQRPVAAPEEASPVGDKNSATVVSAATVATDDTVAGDATVAKNAAVENRATAAIDATVANNATGALFADPCGATVENNATVIFADLPHHPSSADPDPFPAPPSPSPIGRRAVRLRPILRVTDGLTPGQFAVYRLMLEQGEALNPGGDIRLFRGGYLDLVRLTGLSKRGIQNVVGELHRKGVIAVHQAPGYHRSQTTVYQVQTEGKVLALWYSQGFRHAIGKSKDLVNIATLGSSTVASYSTVELSTTVDNPATVAAAETGS